MKLLGRYKGKRRRREPPIVASCAQCPWKSRPMSPNKAEEIYLRHIATVHLRGTDGTNRRFRP